MKGKQRLEFMYNQGISYGAIGYYKTVNEGFDAFKNFLPFKDLNIGKEGDFVAFNFGFDKAQKARIRVMKMKASAEEIIKDILGQLETKGEVSQAKHYTELKSF